MQAVSVDIEDVYDEFSGGLVDPMAIRSFVNYAVDNWDPAPWFICLVGDGTHDYKNNTGTSHPNWMPAYQEGISMFDEWYVRVEGEGRIPDLAIGRLPVQSATEAEGVVDKLISYDSDPEVGPWQSRVLLVADGSAESVGEQEGILFHYRCRVAGEALLPSRLRSRQALHRPVSARGEHQAAGKGCLRAPLQRGGADCHLPRTREPRCARPREDVSAFKGTPT